MPSTDQTAALTRTWRTAIPLLEAMAFEVTHWDGSTLRTQAPLACNHNDKQTGFAGSIAALASITGWGLVTLIGEDAGCSFQAAIRDSHQSYRKPVKGDLQARVTVTDSERRRLISELRDHGKARLTLTVEVGTARDGACACLEGTYVAWQT